MARGSNANSDLYKKLHEEYGLEIDVDFYLHPQSGSYIIKHNAVRKLVAKQREKGFIIETPDAKQIVWINDGTREGIHGKEVVVAGDFYLKNRDGVVIEHVYRTGEVNPKNCKNFYPHAMAEKRLFDRGVIALLRMSQDGLYSDSESDDFRPQKPQKKAPPVKQEVKKVAPLPNKPVPQISVPKLPEKKTPPVSVESQVDSQVEFKIMNIMVENSQGTPKSEIWNMLPNGKEEINEAIDKLMSEGKIIKTGERRGTKYHLNNKENTEQSSLTKPEYNMIWRSVMEDLREKGLEYYEIMNIVNEVTGHDSAIDAFKAGTLTKEHLENIKQKGTTLRA